MTISLAGLRAIDSLATEGSMAAAARALGYTPSAISQQIAGLERDLRQVLVEQHGRVAALSAAGRIVADSARKVLDEIDGMRVQLEAEQNTVAGTLSVAAFATATRGIVPAALHTLLDQWPKLETRLLETDSHRALALVEDGTVDIAVAHDWLAMPLVLSDGLSARRLGDDISDALVHEDHRLACRTSVRMAELAEESWLYEPGSVAHDLLIQAFSAVPHPERFGHVVTEYASQVAMVAVGLGVALVPRMGRGPVPDSVRVLTIEPTPVRQVYAVWRSAMSTRPALQAAVLALKEAFTESLGTESPAGALEPLGPLGSLGPAEPGGRIVIVPAGRT